MNAQTRTAFEDAYRIKWIELARRERKAQGDAYGPGIDGGAPHKDGERLEEGATAILETITQNPGMTLKEIMAAVSMTETPVRKALIQLRNQGRITRARVRGNSYAYEAAA